MTKQDERLAFLTSQENLPIVLEILQEGDRIRSLLFNRFIAALKVYLQDHTTMPQHECELTMQEETEDGFAAVYLRNATLPRENQGLTYSVQHSAEKAGACELTLCLEWADDDIWKHSKVEKLKSVMQLGEYLKAEGLKKGRQWFRYKSIRQDDSPDGFLAAMISEEQQNSLLRQVSDCFWPLVQSTFARVTAANEDIAKAATR